MAEAKLEVITIPRFVEVVSSEEEIGVVRFAGNPNLQVEATTVTLSFTIQLEGKEHFFVIPLLDICNSYVFDVVWDNPDLKTVKLQRRNGVTEYFPVKSGEKVSRSAHQRIVQPSNLNGDWR